MFVGIPITICIYYIQTQLRKTTDAAHKYLYAEREKAERRQKRLNTRAVDNDNLRLSGSSSLPSRLDFSAACMQSGRANILLPLHSAVICPCAIVCASCKRDQRRCDGCVRNALCALLYRASVARICAKQSYRPAPGIYSFRSDDSGCCNTVSWWMSSFSSCSSGDCCRLPL